MVFLRRAVENLKFKSGLNLPSIALDPLAPEQRKSGNGSSPAILSCCSRSNVQIMVLVLLFGNELLVTRLPCGAQIFGVQQCPSPRIAHTTSRLPGGPEDGLAEHLETAAPRLKIYRLNYLCLSEN
jgi:hypothetical protein